MFEKLIYQIEKAEEEQQQLELLARLEEMLEAEPRPAQVKRLKSLLYHRHWYIRREVAFLVDRFGVPLNDEEQLRYHYALQQFDYLVELSPRLPEARKLLFLACSDPSPRFRSRALGYLPLSECKTANEKALRTYAGGDYRQLVEMGSDQELRPAVLKVLQQGLQPQANPLYHRKQCAFALEQLQAMDNAGEFIAGLLEQKEDELPVTPPATPTDTHLSSPFELFLRRLQQQGLIIDGQPSYPEIHLGSATNRVTYRNPGLQTWSKAERLRRIQPQPGFCLLRFDYRTIEPTLLLNFLLQRFIISLADIPPGDIYRAIDPQDRAQGKVWLNAVINGGGRRFRRSLNPLQLLLLQAIDELRQELLQEAWRTGSVETIAGNRLPLDKTETNLGGKAVNRLVQGSASDVFNRAVFSLFVFFQKQNLPARVCFLLFDEVWIEAPPEHVAELAPRIIEKLETVNRKYALLLPLKVRFENEVQPKNIHRGGD